MAVLDTQPDVVVVAAEQPLSFKVGEIVRIAGDVSGLGLRDLPGAQLEPV
ncbi:hypothetical protein [Reyranella sp.]